MTRPLGTREVSGSGGSMELVAHHGDTLPRVPAPDLSCLQEGYACDIAATVPAGGGPFLEPGSVVAWHYNRSVETARAVSDDERGLVVWIPNGSPRLNWTRAVPGSVRDLPLERRFLVTERVWRRSEWRGPGVLRVAPTGKPWSLWWFWRPDGSFDGVYANLELPHRRVSGSPETHTRDLILDLVLDPDGCWLKDADELEAAVAVGQCTPEQADVLRALGEHAMGELLDASAWPFDQGFEAFRPTPELAEVPELPDVPRVREALAALAD